MQRTFLHNVLKMLGGSTLGQLIPFLVLPFLTRIYTPEDFGTLSLFVSTYSLIGAVATLKLEFALVGIRDTRKAVSLVQSILVIAVLAALLTALISYFGVVAKAGFFIELGDAVFLLAPAVLVFAMLETFNYWFNREGKFGTVAAHRIGQNVAAESSKLALGNTAFNAIGLPAGRFSGELLTTLSYGIRFLKNNIQHWSLSAFKEISDNLKEFKEFALFSSPSVLLGKLVMFAQVSLFLHFFGKELVGHLGVIMSLIGAGTAMISRSFSQVFFKHISNLDSVKEIGSEYVKNLRLLTLLGGALVATCWIIPASVATTVLGENWGVLMPYARVMSIWIAVQFVSSAQSFIYIRLNKQKVMMWFDLGHLIMVVASIFIGFHVTGSAMGTVWMYTIARSLFYLVTVLYAISITRKA